MKPSIWRDAANFLSLTRPASRGAFALLAGLCLAVPAVQAQTYQAPVAYVSGTVGAGGQSVFRYADNVQVTFKSTESATNRYRVRTTNATIGAIGAPLSTHFTGATTASPAVVMDIWGEGCAIPGRPTLAGVLCNNRGTMQVTFSQAVTNPIIHLGGLGTNESTTADALRYNAVYQLSSASNGASAVAATVTSLSGNTRFAVTAEGAGNHTNMVALSVSCAAETAACGSVRVNGTVTDVVFNVVLRGYGDWPYAPSTSVNTFSDGHVISASIPVTTVRLGKSLPGGRVSTGDQFALSIAGTGAPPAVTTTGTGTTATGTVTHATATPGSTYTLSETAAGGAVLTNYTSTYSCTNARVGGQTPNGTGTSFSVTPVIGDELACSFANSPVPRPSFTCDARMMQSIGTGASAPDTLNLINTGSNPFVYQPLGTGTVSYNAHGYNPGDNYLYGLQTNTNNLVRIHADGSTVVLGAVAGLPSTGYQAGEVSPAGILYVRNQTTATMYAINLNALPALTATAIPLTGAVVPWQDMAWHNGLLYAASPPPGATGLVSINPTSGLVTSIGASGISGSSIGAMFGTPGAVYGASNGSGFYRFDTTNGIATLISASPPAANNDGSHCATAEITFSSDLAVTKDDGQATYVAGTNVVYTIAVRNIGPFGAQNVTVSDPLPAGITTASWTCASTSGGAVCGAASGTGALNDTGLDLPLNAVATYTLTMPVPAAFTGDLVNTVTVTPGPGNTDPTPGNNSATDTDTPTPRLTLAKTWVNAAINNAVTISLTGTSAPIGGAALNAVANTANETDTSPSPYSVAVGQTYTITEAHTTGLPDGYTRTLACTGNSGAGAAFSYTANALSGTLTVGSSATAITCTFTNVQRSLPNFGSCDARMFLDQVNTTTSPFQSTLYDVGYATSPFTYTSLGVGRARNAIGYNPLDNYIYGIEWNNYLGNELVRIGADGSSLTLGVISGLPMANYNSGVISPSGDYYVKAAPSSTSLYRINIATLTATLVTLSQNITIYDMAWYDGALYTAEGQGVRRINPATGAVTSIGNTGNVSGPIAMWGFSNGVYGTAGGAIYSIDPVTGRGTMMSNAPPAGGADGANCPTASITFAADLAITKTDGAMTYTPGTSVVYTIVASNNGPFGAQNARVQDALPAGITTATWTCTAANGAVCRTASGSGAIDGRVDLPFNAGGPGATATFALTLAVPTTFTGDLVNTATVAVGPGNTDSNSANNSATDTDTPAPRLTLAKIWANAAINDAVTISLTGTPAPTGGAPLNAVANAVNETDTGTPPYGVAVGQTYTITEGHTTGLPDGYARTLACTGNDGAGAAFSYTANALSGTLTVGSTATAITCTFTNTRVAASLQIVKAGSPATVPTGGLVNYTITVTNNGTVPVTGAQVLDTVPAGLDCTTPPLAAPTCSACASAITATALTTAPGVTLTTLAPAALATITLQCRATATGQ